MDKVYDHKKVEERIYKEWEEKGYFQPEINPQGKPYCIILPPPNANGALHFGHAMFAIEDVLIRYHRMKGEQALWLPGADHAGIETQFVFEKKLKNQGKSRLDFDRDTLFNMIKKYVDENRGGIEKQLRRLGFSLDWSREKYTLDPDIVKLVYKTFKKMYDDGLLYRDYRLVNYCTFDGTSFSDLEVVNAEREGNLYYIKFPIKQGGFITIATTRPETLVGDAAVMVNPKDKRHKNLIGKTVILPIVKREIPIIADEYVDMSFGTGAVKVTPSHDFNDFEVAKKHKLTFPPVIGMDGKIKNVKALEGLYVKQARIKVLEMLKEKSLLEKEEKNKMVMRTCYKCKNILEPLPLEQWFVKVGPLKEKAMEAVKSGEVKITPKNFETIYFQWMENLRDWNISRQIVWGIRIPAWFREWKPEGNIYMMGFHDRTEKQVMSGKTKTYRLRDHGVKVGDKFALENSQTEKIFAYGTIQKIEETTVKKIPLDDKAHGATYSERGELIKAFKFHHPELNVNENTKVWIYTYSFGVLQNDKIKEIYVGEEKPMGENWMQDSDTLDTWFSSGQWPVVALMSNSKSKIKNQKSKLNGKVSDFDKFYPTSVMETGYDLLKAWVSRMIMMGIYATGEVPFKDVLFHGLVNDPYGKKMSKSKGNVVNPMELIDQYGADAVRFALIYGNATGNDQALSYPKLDAARKFTNKLWNIARFIEIKREIRNPRLPKPGTGGQAKSEIRNNLTMEQFSNLTINNKTDKEMVGKVQGLVKKVSNDLDNYNFNFAAEGLYEFVWHQFADKYIEDVKSRIDENSFMILNSLFLILLELLHPFIPFVTEEIYQRLKFGRSIMIDQWPSFA